MSIYRLSIMMVLLLSQGCIMYSNKEYKSDFVKESSIQSLAGVYDNASKKNDKETDTPYLSSLIWEHIKIDHEYLPAAEIRFVQVEAFDKGLIVSAIRNECIVKTSVFYKGRDFTFKNGRLEIKKSRLANERYGFNKVTGAKSEKIVIGVDTEGNGKYRRSETTVGVGLFFIPEVHSSNEDIIFSKVATSTMWQNHCAEVAK